MLGGMKMISASNTYKEIMDRPIRNRSFISVGMGIVNQDAQSNGSVNGDLAYWSHGNIFNTNQSRIEYATMEENFFKVDGSMFFMPEEDEYIQLKNNGIVTSDIMGKIRIDFPEIYAIKGITLDFGDNYPTEFTIKTSENLLTYSNSSNRFTTDDALGDTRYIIITPIQMLGGQQRMRLKSVLMGVGLAYTNEQTQSFSLNEYVSSISAELSSEDIEFSFFDEEGRFNVDDDNSFIDYLETMQKVTFSFGLELDDGTIEWKKIATTYLKAWKSKNGIVSIESTDRLNQMEDVYSLGNKIYDRTAYDEAISIFEDAGLQPDEYYVDEYLKDVNLTNPLPEGSHRECLQILANACRCIIKQDPDGKVLLSANFANVLNPEEMDIFTNGVTEWSEPNNIFMGSYHEYADMTKDFFKVDGSMFFLPENDNYLETAYVSSEISDENGLFSVNPKITISMPAAYTYYGVSLQFGGNPPSEMIIHAYKEDVLQESILFDNLGKISSLTHDFVSFDKIVFEFTKGYPNNRILVNTISFGSLSDYTLKKNNMIDNPIGYKEKRVKNVRVKIFTFENNEQGLPEQVDDNVHYIKSINPVGETKVVQNPLVSTTEHAERLAEWVGNYYANNISYDVEYRGEPRISASDIIHMESEKKSNLQVEITKHSLKFNGALSGSLELRRALRMVGV